MRQLEEGSLLGEYEIVEKIAEGGMGCVYLGKEIKLARNVAIKVMQYRLRRDLQTSERFKNEAKIVAQINHPNIVTIHHFGSEEDFDYIIMEFIDGENLQEIINKGPLDLARALNLFKQLLQGLDAAHQKNITHRDIKPSNLMVSQYGFLKILDFGLAKSHELSSRFYTTTEPLLGTTGYLSPEVARGDKPNHLSDLYSAGIVFYEMLSGQQPFKGDTPLSVIENIKTQELPPLSLDDDSHGVQMQEIINRLCHKDPQKRFQSCQEVLQLLDHLSLKSQKNISKENFSVIEERIDNENGLPEQQSAWQSRYSHEEVQKIQEIALEIQQRNMNTIGRKTLLSLGDEMQLSEEALEEAIERFHKIEKTKKAEGPKEQAQGDVVYHQHRSSSLHPLIPMLFFGFIFLVPIFLFGMFFPVSARLNPPHQRSSNSFISFFTIFKIVLVIGVVSVLVFVIRKIGRRSK